MKAAYPRVHERVLTSLIAIAKRHPEDGPDRVEPLRELAKSVPGEDRARLAERLSKPPRQDAFTDYLRINFPSTRGAFLSALGAKQEAAAPAKAEPSTPSQGFGALNKAKGDPKYIDNGISKVRTDGLRAEIFYRDGAKLDLGLVPDTIASPFEGVDYRTARGEIAALDPTTPGTIRILPHQRKLVPPKATYKEFLRTARKRAREVRFVVESASGRLVPTEVNSLTAPLLSATLRKADEENEALAEATSEGGVKVFTMFQHVLELYAFLTPAKAMRPATAAGTRAVPRAAAAFARRRSALARALGEAAAKGTVIDQIVVEGVSLGALKALREGGALTVRYAFIQRIGSVAGRGRMAQWALEEAAKDVARAHGAKIARVWVEGPIQPKWLAYLESVGYSWSAEAFPAGMVKVLSL
jgi:hypothetical protein